MVLVSSLFFLLSFLSLSCLELRYSDTFPPAVCPEYQQLHSHAIKHEFDAFTNGPGLIYLINVFTQATSAMFIDLVLGCLVKMVFPKLHSTGDMGAGTATITMKRPVLGLDAIARCTIKWMEVGVTCCPLMMKRRIEVLTSKKSWKSTGCYHSG